MILIFVFLRNRQQNQQQMQVDHMYDVLTSHYKKSRTLKTKRSIQIESIVGQSYKKKSKEADEQSPIEDFLRNQSHVAVEEQPLYFRSLPRKLKVYFPGPPSAPPKLQQIPYTYETVPKVPFKMPKPKPGFVGEWVVEQCSFVQRKTSPTRKNKSVSENYRKNQKSENKSLMVNHHDRRQRFRSEVKKLVSQMRQKNLSLKQIIKNRGIVKKPHSFYNSVDFFLMCRNGDKGVQDLLSSNPQLAFDVDEQQMTGLHWAAREGHANICRILIQKYRASCHAKDCYGRTPLHLAVQNKNIECIIRIFIQGGQMNAITKQHKTVRMVANDSYIKYLIQKLEEIKFVINSKNYQDREQKRVELETAVRNTLDESSLYF